ncbi:hypothetical protein C7M84_000140 [Penaeus vannamei]|uniref:Uncharacterized protein n=1 Tax=Penaeus vannamei TaxID=6689 RepID=A0A423TXD2_PENVA|nr:hypothetical protein C7M84_000140 [Penaeus vannamei]
MTEYIRVAYSLAPKRTFCPPSETAFREERGRAVVAAEIALDWIQSCGPRAGRSKSESRSPSLGAGSLSAHATVTKASDGDASSKSGRTRAAFSDGATNATAIDAREPRMTVNKPPALATYAPPLESGRRGVTDYSGLRAGVANLYRNAALASMPGVNTGTESKTPPSSPGALSPRPPRAPPLLDFPLYPLKKEEEELHYPRPYILQPPSPNTPASHPPSGPHSRHAYAHRLRLNERSRLRNVVEVLPGTIISPFLPRWAGRNLSQRQKAPSVTHTCIHTHTSLPRSLVIKGFRSDANLFINTDNDRLYRGRFERLLFFLTILIIIFTILINTIPPKCQKEDQASTGGGGEWQHLAPWHYRPLKRSRVYGGR